MEALTYSYTRTHLAQVMRSVNEDRAPVLVTTQRGKPVVIMSLDDYNALEETAYLLRSPKGAKRRWSRWSSCAQAVASRAR
ncbi:MAG: type II toxin-antitoxin system prevent-host-death family antitoxin [Rhodocyclaceae bacterium]